MNNFGNSMGITEYTLTSLVVISVVIMAMSFFETIMSSFSTVILSALMVP